MGTWPDSRLVGHDRRRGLLLHRLREFGCSLENPVLESRGRRESYTEWAQIGTVATAASEEFATEIPALIVAPVVTATATVILGGSGEAAVGFVLHEMLVLVDECANLVGALAVEEMGEQRLPASRRCPDLVET